MADGFQMLGFCHVEVFALQPVPQTLSPNRFPKLAGLLATEGEQFRHGADAFFVEALFSASADAGQVAEGEAAERLGEDVEGEGYEAVGLFHVAGNLGKVAIGGEANRATQERPDLLLDARL